MVSPFMARTTSPGRCAVPDGMFSVAAMRPCTSTGRRSLGRAEKRPRTVAAPAMSSFIRYMPSAGLRSSPPESKVMPLPMMATRRRARPLAGGGALAPLGLDHGQGLELLGAFLLEIAIEAIRAEDRAFDGGLGPRARWEAVGGEIGGGAPRPEIAGAAGRGGRGAAHDLGVAPLLRAEAGHEHARGAQATAVRVHVRELARLAL